MSSHAYYEDLKSLAREKRTAFGVVTAAFGLREAREIYKAEGICIDYWPLPSKIKALYMCADGDVSVAVQRTLPDEPKLFALIHELKHHYRDREALGAGVIHCGDYNQNVLIEKGAEVFAAEFIYPEAEFMEDTRPLGLAAWGAENVVHFKRTCKAKVSYRFLCKRLERAGLVEPGKFDGVKFQNLEDSLYGVPFYRRRPYASRSASRRGG
jgi:Zn-dependent peptidase ImmA (M78 family)